MADRIFDFNKTEESKAPKTGSGDEGSLVTWQMRRN